MRTGKTLACTRRHTHITTQTPPHAHITARTHASVQQCTHTHRTRKYTYTHTCTHTHKTHPRPHVRSTKSLVAAGEVDAFHVHMSTPLPGKDARIADRDCAFVAHATHMLEARFFDPFRSGDVGHGDGGHSPDDYSEDRRWQWPARWVADHPLLPLSHTGPPPEALGVAPAEPATGPQAAAELEMHPAERAALMGSERPSDAGSLAGVSISRRMARRRGSSLRRLASSRSRQEA